MSTDHDLDEVPAEDAPRPRKRLRNGVLFGAAVLAVGAGAAIYSQVKPVVDAQKYAEVTYEVPNAPKLTAKPGETVYRIDPTKSSLTYEVQETFAGKDTSVAKGVTNGIAGDIAVNADDLAASRLGRIVANVEQFHSDNNLRDARLRAEFLRSSAYPLAAFQVDEVDGLEGKLAVGETYEFTMSGTATVKGEQTPVTFDAEATLGDDGALRATATTTVKLSDVGAGPISIAGLVRTEDEATLTLELTAWDPEKRAIPTTITGPDAKEPKDAPSFASTVQPILEANCVSCHATGQMAGDHLPLDDAGDARDISDGLKTVTQLGYMPPWPASDVGVPLAHEMKLTDAEIAAIAAWADAGGVLDVDADTPLVAPKDAGGPTPRKDIVLEREAYTGDPKLTNDYRCFVLDPKLTEPTYLTGYTFLPDQLEELHHVQVFHISEVEKADAANKDGVDGRPGWSCYSGPNLRGRGPAPVPGRPYKRDRGFVGQSNLVAGWVPGQAPAVFPLDSGILMQPGEALVMQIHYHYAGTSTEDRSTLAIQTEPGDSDVKAMRVINPLAPVEIPCLPEDQDLPLCDRDAALEEIDRLYGVDNEGGLLMLCNTTPEEMLARFGDGDPTSTCDHVVPEDGTIVAVLGHMHTIGKSIRLTLDPDTPDEAVLLDIPDWSFDWQMNYELATPIKVKAGQPLKLECSWDRTRDPAREQRYIVFAEGTEDEMCFATYALIPDDQG